MSSYKDKKIRELPEGKLIDLAIEGNEDAWREVYRRYYSRVKRVVAWKKWHFKYAEVEEITQDIFLELVKALPRFRREASLSTFLTRLAKNKCISVLRRKGAQKRAREEYHFVFDEKPHDNENRWVYAESDIGKPEKELLFGEEASLMMEALSQLSGDCREIISKRYFDDLAYKEICQALDLPLGTVCSRLKRCLSKLRKKYAENLGKISK